MIGKNRRILQHVKQDIEKNLLDERVKKEMLRLISKNLKQHTDKALRVLSYLRNRYPQEHNITEKDFDALVETIDEKRYLAHGKLLASPIPRYSPASESCVMKKQSRSSSRHGLSEKANLAINDLLFSRGCGPRSEAKDCGDFYLWQGVVAQLRTPDEERLGNAVGTSSSLRLSAYVVPPPRSPGQVGLDEEAMDDECDIEEEDLILGAALNKIKETVEHVTDPEIKTSIYKPVSECELALTPPEGKDMPNTDTASPIDVDSNLDANEASALEAEVTEVFMTDSFRSRFITGISVWVRNSRDLFLNDAQGDQIADFMVLENGMEPQLSITKLDDQHVYKKMCMCVDLPESVSTPMNSQLVQIVKKVVGGGMLVPLQKAFTKFTSLLIEDDCVAWKQYFRNALFDAGIVYDDDHQQELKKFLTLREEMVDTVRPVKLEFLGNLEFALRKRYSATLSRGRMILELGPARNYSYPVMSVGN